MTRLIEYSTFLREFRTAFDTTGAVLPSGRFLARALARPLRERLGGAAANEPVRVLEVGPGTGAVTDELVRHIQPHDCFHVVELNDRFVKLLERRFQVEPRFRRVADRTSIFHVPVQELHVDAPYDFIICGLPFNNFPPDLVDEILSRLIEILRPAGSLTFFEYLGVRPMKRLISRPAKRRHVTQVGSVLRKYLDRYEHARGNVYLNMLPAVAHYLRSDGNGSTNGSANGSSNGSSANGLANGNGRLVSGGNGHARRADDAADH